MIKDASTSQEHPASSKPPSMSSIFQSVLDAFKLNRFTPNFKHNFLKAYADHPKNHQGHIPIMIKETSTSQEHPASTKPPAMSSIFQNVLDAFKLNRFTPNFKHSFIRAFADHPKSHQGHQPQLGMSIILIESSNNCSDVIDL